MSEECNTCRYATDLKGCASKHVSEALKQLSEGKIAEVNQNLENLEKHLKEQ